MMKKDIVYRQSNEAKKSFQGIKEAIVEAPTLVSPNFDKEFLLYILPLMFHMPQSSPKKMMMAMKSLSLI